MSARAKLVAHSLAHFIRTVRNGGERTSAAAPACREVSWIAQVAMTPCLADSEPRIEQARAINQTSPERRRKCVIAAGRIAHGGETALQGRLENSFRVQPA